MSIGTGSATADKTFGARPEAVSAAGHPDTPAQVGAAALLAIESKVRAAKDEIELLHLIANELRKLVAGRQAVIVRAARQGRFEVACVSSLVVTDRESPFVRWIEGMVAQIASERGLADAINFELPAFVAADAAETLSYPFSQFVWQPLHLTTGEVFAGILIARERPWSVHDQRIIARQAEVFSGNWLALHGSASLRPRRLLGRGPRWAIAMAGFAAAFLPVPMTTLAPVEIVAREPQRVTAPIDGVVAEILIEPNKSVKTGDVVLRLEQTALKNRLLLAEQEMAVAKARFDRASQAAFSDEKARHDVAQARAEFDLKAAERSYAADVLQRSEVVAERAGLLVYLDKDRWIGRPVKTGERLMQIVDPAAFAARIDLPVADAIVLDRGAYIRLFLDADPLTAVPARLVSEGYQAEPNSTQQLVYRLVAELDRSAEGVRIGSRGTAQLVGGPVPLAFYLLRRPISAARQYVGL